MRLGLRKALLCPGLALLAACTTMVPRKDLPPPLTGARFADPVKVVTIPLPVVAASPNEGVSYGGLTAFLLHNAENEVDTLVAPQLNYNENFGLTGTLYGKFVPLPERSWEINLSRSSKVNRDYELRIRDRTFSGGRLELEAFLFSFTDGSARFFGFHASSPASAESNFGDRELGFTSAGAYEVRDFLWLRIAERFRKVEVVRGALPSLPSTASAYSPAQVPGVDGFTTHAQKIALVYDSSDFRNMPTRGVLASASVEGSFEALGSSADFQRYNLELRGYLPLAEARAVTAIRVAASQVSGRDVPFLEQCLLGGETTLRGYGRNRFIDKASVLFNAEERIRAIRWAVFDVNTDWEIAPFVDIGAVAGSLGRVAWSGVEVNPGIGFRGVVRPNIVGRIDVGYGRDGVAVFVGLDYPY
jgi:Omp85 superfamily domain